MADVVERGREDGLAVLRLATPIRLATLPDDGPTGGFFGDDGPIPR